jgi:hypothetical protein
LSGICALGKKTAFHAKYWFKPAADFHRTCSFPAIQGYVQDSTCVGNALLNPATALLRSKLAAEEVNPPTNILNTAVQLAVTALKAPE